uniref:sedoheptulokinase-like isoform X1 n=2 Tax=Styela clava TaxID=7725 RepID=UPI00193A5BA3|nr:sedoheptulokinase-like isoform X1 [Styela clava]
MTDVLGIDIGTTSVKVVVVSEDNGEPKIFGSKNLCHNANLTSSDNVSHFEQNPTKILTALKECLRLLKEEIGTRITTINTISICGQMHGCVLWNSDDQTNVENDGIYYPCSNLITWQDQRCDSEFILSLPVPEKCVPVSTGFGCATMFWLRKNSPEILSKYNCAGTIMDYVIASLCKLRKPIMSTQNAMSWGYYNFIDRKWNLKLLKKNDFPVNFLPDIVNPGNIVGKSQIDWCDIPAGIDITVGLGDMQCSVLSCDPDSSTGVFNLGTAAQLSTILPIQSGIEHYSLKYSATVPSSSICVPYFGEFCLWTSASLNGGAVFEKFARMMHRWTVQFVPSLTMSDIYEKLIDIDSDAEPATSMTINPTIYGERHDPNKQASAQYIGPEDDSISTVSNKLAFGIIRNVFDMFNSGMEERHVKIKTLLAHGTAFEKNTLFRKALKQISGVECKFDVILDGAYGVTRCKKYT